MIKRNTMRHYSLFLCLAILVASCASNQGTKSTKFQDLKVKHLENGDIFVYPKVKSYLENHTFSEQHQLDFLKGLDAFKNKKDLDSAIYYFEVSILSHPTGIAYYEMGNAYMDKKAYDDAILAYEMAERLDYDPFFKILYNIACAYSLKEDSEKAAQYLEYAIQAGYSNIDNINKDPDLANLRKDSWTFKSHFNRALKGLSNTENLFWLQFKRQFNPTKYPLKLDDNLDILLLTEETRISYDFEKYIAEMRDEKFSREVSKGFYYLSKVKENANYVALIYVIKEEFLGDYAPLTYRLATFTNAGKLIDKKEIAGRTDFEKPLKTALISQDGNIEITSYETEFEKDPKEEGYYNNKIAKKSKVGTEIFTINTEGKIVKSENTLSSANY